MKERDVQREILLEHGHGDVRLFRQNVGMGWTGKVVSKTPHRLVLDDPRPLHAGLCVGSSDIIGWRTVEVTPDMVGSRLAVFVGIEAKGSKGRASKDQLAFIRVLHEAGGLAGIARSAGDAGEILGKGKS